MQPSMCGITFKKAVLVSEKCKSFSFFKRGHFACPNACWSSTSWKLGTIPQKSPHIANLRATSHHQPVTSSLIRVRTAVLSDSLRQMASRGLSAPPLVLAGVLPGAFSIGHSSGLLCEKKDWITIEHNQPLSKFYPFSPARPSVKQTYKTQETSCHSVLL